MKPYLLALFGIICVTQIHGQLSKGDRIISFQVDMAENANYDSAFFYAKEACIESVHLAFSWADMEPTPGNIGGSSYNLLDVVNAYYPAQGTSVELNIPVVNTVVREVPTDLSTVPFSNQVMIDRFKVLLDSVFKKIPAVDLAALTIGNESDIFWGTDSTKYWDFKIFLDSVSTYAKNTYFNQQGKNLKIGSTMTHKGLVSPSKSSFISYVNQNTDIVSLTYYGTQSNGDVIDPDDVVSAFNDIVSLYPDTSQPLYFVECGYPSSPFLNSSEEKQRRFIEKVFEAWDSNYANIKYISFFKTTDWSQATVDTLAVYYGLPNDTAFKEFLRTLGLRTYPGNGQNKLAYEQLKCELSDRSWCNTTCNPVGFDQFDLEYSSFQLHPNPSQGSLTIQFNQNVEGEIRIYSATGRIVYQRTFESTDKCTFVLPSQLKNGMYFLQTIGNSERSTSRFILQR